MASVLTDILVPGAASHELALWAQRNSGRDVLAAERQNNDAEVDDDASVQVNLSAEARDLLSREESASPPVEAGEDAAESSSDGQQLNTAAQQEAGAAAQADEDVDQNGLTPAEEDLVRRLQARDAEVRQHEQRHMAAAGDLAVGGPQYTYQTGPDGKSYAIGGHVNIDTSIDFSDPGAKSKADRIRRAANAGGDNSAADSSVAARASSLEQKAVAETYYPGRAARPGLAFEYSA